MSKIFSSHKIIFLTCFICMASATLLAQGFNKGILKGKVFDGNTNQPLYGASISGDSTLKMAHSAADGSYTLQLSNKTKTIYYRLKGFQTKAITDISITANETTFLDIILFPLKKTNSIDSTIVRNDSTQNSPFNISDTIKHADYNKERTLVVHNNTGTSQFIAEQNIEVAPAKDATDLLKKTNGLIISNGEARNSSSFNINGLGERYNQVLLNGTILNSVDPFTRSYVLDIIPAETIENIGIQKISNVSAPADFSGGIILIDTKDYPDKNYYYVQLGVNISDATTGKVFFSDKKNNGEFFSLPGSARSLPAEFPTTRSKYAFNDKNIQNQVYLSRQLKNNLAPVSDGNSKPNDKISIGFGRLIKLKKVERFAVTGFISQQKKELIESNSVQVAPDVAGNPFPFSDDKKILINAQSEDITYTYASQIAAGLNSAVIFGKNKISLRTIYSSQFINSYTQREQVSKADEDSLAHTGIYYKTEQRKFLNVQLSGEHALGALSKLKLSWQASYAYYKQKNPDERNFLLRQDSTNKEKYEIAHQAGVANDIKNTSRLWRNTTEHNFTGAFNLSFPFSMFHQQQLLAGGVYIQTKYRVFYSDLLLVKGSGYFSLQDLLSADRYYPGGLSVSNYFSNHPSYQDPTDRANYTASSNTSASYLRLENKFNDHISLDWGLRVESCSQLVSATQYNYFEGFRNPQISTIDQNVNVSKLSLLPAVNVKYKLLNRLQLHAAWFKTLSRPQQQELSIYRYYDASRFMIKTGNPQLRNSYINNYDLGVTWNVDAYTNISVSGFYKLIDQPIEYILSSYSTSTLLSTPYNTAPAKASGLAISINLDLNTISNSLILSGISLFTNASWCKTSVDEGPLKAVAIPYLEKHNLSGSPSNSINGGLVFQVKKYPAFTFLYNHTSDYIVAVGSGPLYTLENGNKVSAVPDYRIKGYGTADLLISQKMFRSKIKVTAGINNVFGNSYIEYQDLDGNKKFGDAIVLQEINNKPGFYKSGTDNTIVNKKGQRNYFLTLTYLFK